MSERTPAIVRTIAELRATSAGETTGFVPTMGFLHEGHAALIRQARAECARVVASIFVNPTQFGPGEDFTTYPRDEARDVALLARERVDVVFAPSVDEMYPRGSETTVAPGAVATVLEGASRPGHFRGVATVVTMLLNAVQPTHVYFGEKDWQQLQVVRQLVRDLHLPCEVVGVPTAREADGLALSSRNVRLSAEERVSARCVPRAIAAARAAFASGENRPDALAAAMAAVIVAEPAARLDYAAVVDPYTLQPITVAKGSSRALIAARVGTVRLIDNSALV